MTVERTITKTETFTCDACGLVTERITNNDAPMYSPVGWALMHIAVHEYDTLENYHICPSCLLELRVFIKNKRRSPAEAGGAPHDS